MNYTGSFFTIFLFIFFISTQAMDSMEDTDSDNDQENYVNLMQEMSYELFPQIGDILSSQSFTLGSSNEPLEGTNQEDNKIMVTYDEKEFVLPREINLLSYTWHLYGEKLKKNDETCDLCDAVCKNKRLLEEHKHANHDPNGYSCTKCSKKFNSQLALRQHRPNGECLDKKIKKKIKKKMSIRRLTR